MFLKRSRRELFKNIYFCYRYVARSVIKVTTGWRPSIFRKIWFQSIDFTRKFWKCVQKLLVPLLQKSIFSWLKSSESLETLRTCRTHVHSKSSKYGSNPTTLSWWASSKTIFFIMISSAQPLKLASKRDYGKSWLNNLCNFFHIFKMMLGS